MKPKSNYKDIVTESDRFKSTSNKNDLIYLIRKFLLNNDNSTPSTTYLRDLGRKQLFAIWDKNKPRDLYSQFHYDNVKFKDVYEPTSRKDAITHIEQQISDLRANNGSEEKIKELELAVLDLRKWIYMNHKMDGQIGIAKSLISIYPITWII